MASENNTKSEISSLIHFAGAGIFFGGIGLFIYQIYLWLKFGKWVGYSLLEPLYYTDNVWVYAPREWVGVHKILDSFPLSLFLIILGMIIFYIGVFVEEN